MKNTILIIAATAFVSAAASVGDYRYLDSKTSSNSVSQEKAPVGYAAFKPDATVAAVPDFVQAAASVSPAVVHIKTTYTRSMGSRNPLEELFGGPGDQTGVARASGSGVLISADGYIVTNNHVVENATEIQVSLTDRRSFRGKLIGRDPSTDLALIKVEGANLPVVELGNSDQVQVGDWVLAIGYPLSLNSTVTAGIISAKGRSIGILDKPTEDPATGQGVSTAIESFLQTDAAINPGNSGGALVSASGQLIGINAAIASQTGSYAGYGFAIPVNLVKKVVTDLRSFGEVKRGFLGVSFPAPSVEDELLREQNINPASVKGVYITEVQPGSAAAGAGLRAGDVIQRIDEVAVNSSAEFSERIARHRPGDKVPLTYLRGGKTTSVTVTLQGESSGESPSTTASAVLSEKLGASFGAVPANAKQYFRLSSGILVTSISKGGFFERAGIPKNTIITSVNGKLVNSSADLNVALGISRNGMARIEGITPDGMRFIFNFPLGA